MNKNIRGVFFDLYGTLLIFNNIEKSWQDWAVTFYEFIKEKTHLSFEEFSKNSSGFMNREVVKDSSSGLSTYETRIKDHCASLSIPLTEPELKSIANETPLAWQKYISLAEDVPDVLPELKKTKILALITNFDHAPHIRRTLNHFDLEKYFDAIIISDEINCCKPDPKIFELALSKTKLKPGEVIFVGDNLNDDIAGARASYIEPLLIMHETFSAVHDYEHNPQENKDKPVTDATIIHSLKELLNLC